MPVFQSLEELEAYYEKAAYEYSRRLRPEDLMEGIEQARQREITLESLALVKARRPEVHVFNEMLLQYPDPDGVSRRPRQVVPDNMIVISSEPLTARTSYNLPTHPNRPFCVMEYVSKSNTRKDYEENMVKYEHHLKVPYYLRFYPDIQELTLYHHNGERYVTVLPNGNGRHAIPDLQLEVGLQDGWMRYWFRGELLPLPADLLRDLDETRRQVVEARRERDEARSQAEQERQARQAVEQELERLRAELARRREG